MKNQNYLKEYETILKSFSEEPPVEIEVEWEKPGDRFEKFTLYKNSSETVSTTYTEIDTNVFSS